MATVTGTLNDFGLQAMAHLDPRIVFTLSGPAVTTSRVLLATRSIVVPVTEGHGFWSVELATTVGMRPERVINTRVEWRDPDFYGEGSGFIGVDFHGWQLFVPPEGGSFADLVSAPSNPESVWVGPTPPENAVPGTWWLNTDPESPDYGWILEME